MAAKSAKQAILDSMDQDIADLQRARKLVAAHGDDEPVKKPRKPRTKRGLPATPAHEQ